jgi:hypothetical protein
MQRNTFLKLFLPGLGYMVMGNFLAAIMTFSLYSFMGAAAVQGMAVLFAAAIYLLLVGVPAYKNGLAERSMLENKRVESVPVYRWAGVGVILFVIAVIPSVLLVLGVLNIGWFRLICGAVGQLSMFLDGLPFAPYVYMGFYALTILSCHVGFMLGLGDKLNKDKILYK